MVYQSGKMALKSVMKVFSGKVNDVEICRNIDGDGNAYFTVLVLKDRDTVKKLIHAMESKPEGMDCAVDMFTCNNEFCIVFDYVKERKFTEFFRAKEMSLALCEEIAVDLVVQCMTSRLPYPLLELVLKQRQLQLLKDNKVVISYVLDLAELDENCTEEKCVKQCALIVRDMLEQKSIRKNVSYTLLSKKIPKNSYTSFRELYKDISLATSTITKWGMPAKIKAFFREHDKTFFKIILGIGVVFVGATVLILLGKWIFGDSFIMRLFMDTFEQIGTESLI